MNQPVCSDENLGRQIFRRSMLPTGLLQLPLALQQHAEECPYCSKNLGSWKKKAYFALKMAEAQRIIRESSAPGTQVLTRQVGNQRLFFKFADGAGKSGVLVVTDRSGNVTQIDDTDVGAFESFG
jgi:hypothetical protein